METVRHNRDQDKSLQMEVSKKPESKKRGLILSGGGAKSIFQAQVLKRLRDSGYRFDLISGVSAGSLNAAIASQEKGNLVEFWRNITRDDIFSGGITLWKLISLLFGWKAGVYENDGLEKFLRKHYKPSETKTPFVVGAVNLHTAEYNEFEVNPGDKATTWREEEIYNAIIASSSIPLVFPPVEDLGTESSHLFTDGGLRNTTPLRPVVNRGVDEILVITCSPRHLGTTAKDLNTPFEVAERSFDILLNEIVREDIDSVLKVNRMVKEHEKPQIRCDGREYRHIDISLIEPRFGLGGMLDFSEDVQDKRIEEANNVCNRMLEKSVTKSYTRSLEK